MNQSLLNNIKTKAEPVLRSHDVEFAAVFGSAARGEATLESDIDILIRYSKSPGLWDHIGLAQELSETLGSKVDLVSERFIHPYIKENIQTDLQVIYGKRRYL